MCLEIRPVGVLVYLIAPLGLKETIRQVFDYIPESSERQCTISKKLYKLFAFILVLDMLCP